MISKYMLSGTYTFLPRGFCSIEGDGSDNAGAGGGLATDASSAERALEFWDQGDSAADTGQRSAEDQGGGEQQQNADQAADGQQQADQQKPAITDEQLAADPRYQEASKFRDEVQPILDQHNIPDPKELGLQLADASILYQLAAGQAPPSRLLDVMIQNSGWTKEQVNGVAADLMGWLTKNGYLRGDQGNAGDSQFRDPLEQKVSKLEETIAERDRRQEQERVQGAERERQTRIFDSYTTKLGELCAAKGIEKQDIEYYGREIRALMPEHQFKAIIGRIEKGNFVDVQKLFDQVYSRETARLKRYSEKAMNDATRRQNTAPRVPAGGAPPAPKGGQQKRDLRTSEGRQAAALEEWDR